MSVPMQQPSIGAQSRQAIPPGGQIPPGSSSAQHQQVGPPPPPQPHPISAMQAQQQQHEQEAKRMQDLIEALNLITVLRESMNSIIDNVGKINSSNNYAQILTKKPSNASSSDSNTDPAKLATVSSNQVGSNSVATPSSVSSANPQSGSNLNEQDQVNQEESSDRLFTLNLEQQEFFEKTDNKYLLDRVIDVNKSIVELDKIIKELQPIPIVNLPDFNTILLDQNEERSFVSSSKLLNSYRWYNKVTESITNTTLNAYKRFQQTYAERKSLRYKSYSFKSFKKEELDKNASSFLANSEIKVVSMQKTEHQFVIDIIMPQNFKFVLLMFDLNVEKFQVRPLDSRLLKIYSNNKPSEEICHFDFEPKTLSNVFQRLEDNCLYALLYFKTESGPAHFKYFLQWLRHFSNLLNAKCVRCEKHLQNCVPPTWRDLKTNEAFHDECRIY